MNKTPVFCRLLACVFLLAVFAGLRLSRGGEPDNSITPASGLADTNGMDLAVFPWGNPQFTDGKANFYPRPPWILAACMDGGLWITNDTWYGWQPSLGSWTPDLATNRLLIQIDRTLVSSNLWIAVAGTGESNVTLLAGFYDNELLAVAEPVALHVADAQWFTNCIDLSGMPFASVISLSASNGVMRIFNSVLLQAGSTLDGNGLESSGALSAPSSDNLSGAPAASTARNVAASPSTNSPSLHSRRATPVARTGTHTWYVDQLDGNDLYDGAAERPAPPTSTGPKKSVAEALAEAVVGDTISVAEGNYAEHVYLGRVRMVTHGHIVMR